MRIKIIILSLLAISIQNAVAQKPDHVVVEPGHLTSPKIIYFGQAPFDHNNHAKQSHSNEASKSSQSISTLQQQNENLKRDVNQLNDKVTVLQQALDQSNQSETTSLNPSKTTVFTAIKKIGGAATNIILRHFPDDPKLALKATACLFSIVIFLFVFAIWPTHKKRWKKEQRNLLKKEKIQAARIKRQEKFLKKIDHRREKLKKHLAKKQQRQQKIELREQQKFDEKSNQLEPETSASTELSPETLVAAVYSNILQPSNSISQQLDLARYWLTHQNYEAMKQALRPVFARGNKLQQEEARLLLEEAMMASEHEV